MKKILIIALIGITALACKKDDEITGTTNPTNPNDTTNNDTTIVLNGIEGRWMVSQAVFTETEIGTETDLFDNSTDSINYIETYTVSGDSLEGAGAEFLNNGSVIFFDNSGNDTATYSYSNSTLTIYGDDFIFDEDTSIIDVSNLTSNSMNWNYTYTEREIENDSSQGFLSDITYTETNVLSFVK